MSAKVSKILSMLMAASMLLALFACQPVPTQAPQATEAATQPPAGNRVLKVWHYESDTGAMGKAWLAAKAEFEATHPGVTVEKVVAETGWPLKVAPTLETTSPPTAEELAVLRDLQERTARAHAGQA